MSTPKLELSPGERVPEDVSCEQCAARVAAADVTYSTSGQRLCLACHTAAEQAAVVALSAASPRKARIRFAAATLLVAGFGGVMVVAGQGSLVGAAIAVVGLIVMLFARFNARFSTAPGYYTISRGKAVLLYFCALGIIFLGGALMFNSSRKAAEEARIQVEQRNQAEAARLAASKPARERAALERRARVVAEWRSTRTRMRDFHAGMTPKLREEALRGRCPSSGVCDRTWETIVASATSDEERKQLEALADKLCGACEVEGRRALARDLARDLGARNPGLQIDADGPEERRLRITGSPCTDDFLADLVNSGAHGFQIRDAGFREVTCKDGSSAVTKLEER